MKIAIVGSSANTKDKAPFEDNSWSIWGLAWNIPKMPRCDRAFELHTYDYIRKTAENFKAYKAGIQSHGSVYCLPKEAKRFGGKPYPLLKVQKEARCNEDQDENYFTSSIAYMLAWAFVLKPDQVGIYGVDLAQDTEYIHQKPCVEYWVGKLRGAGVRVHVEQPSSLLHMPWQYGLEDPVDSALECHRMNSEIRDYTAACIERCIRLGDVAQNDVQHAYLQGFSEAMSAVNKALDLTERGVSLEKVA